MFAHYFASKAGKFIIITPTPSLADTRQMKIEVDGKVDARKKAEYWNAKPWNF